MADISWLGVAAALAASFVVGFLWYSPLLFVKPWMRELGITPDKAQAGSMGLIFAGMFALRGIAAVAMSWMMGPRRACTSASCTTC